MVELVNVITVKSTCGMLCNFGSVSHRTLRLLKIREHLLKVAFCRAPRGCPGWEGVSNTGVSNTGVSNQ